MSGFTALVGHHGGKEGKARAKPTHHVEINGKQVGLSFADEAWGKKHDKLLDFKGFQDWVNGMDESLRVRSIHVESLDFFGTVVRYVKMHVEAFDESGQELPGTVFLRGKTVGVMCIITCDDDQKQYVVMAVHPRVATGRVNTPELPTGFLEDSGDFAGKVAEAIEQDIGLRLSDKDMTDLTQMSIGQHWPGVYGIGHESDETIRIFLYRSRMSGKDLAHVERRCTGLLEPGDTLKLMLIPIYDLWRCPDAKALSALCIFENLVARREIAVSGVAIGGKELAGNGRLANANASRSDDASASAPTPGRTSARDGALGAKGASGGVAVAVTGETEA